MKKAIIGIITAALLPLIGYAIDANQLHYVELLPAQTATLINTNVALLTPVSVSGTNATAGTAVDVSAYEGYGLLVIGQGARSDADATSKVWVAYSHDDSTYVEITTATQASATAKYTPYEFDFDTLQGTNAALYLKATATNLYETSAGMIASVSLMANVARAAQTNTGSAVDVSAYKGNATLVCTMGGAFNESAVYTNTVTFQHSTNGAANWATVTNLAGTAGVEQIVGATGEVDTFPIDLSRLHKYVRAVSVQQNDVGSVGVVLVAPMKSE